MKTAMYYVLLPGTTPDGDMMGLTHKKDFPERDYFGGGPFVSEPGAKPWDRHPQEPLVLTIKKGRETAPLPSFLRQPVPVMSQHLFETLRAAGVDNIDFYRAEIRFEDGRLASTDYYVFNILGLVRAVDLKKSDFDPSQPDRMISMGFDAATINPAAAREFLMFRLAENVTTIVVHEKIKKAIETARIELIRIDPIEDVALL
jgi:hypothetical protein